VNEIAPRTHNSGHYSFGACATSQFEQHVRAICGLPLGDPALLRPAVMLNLLGDLWAEGEPRWDAVLRHSGARLHLYGKGRASPGRKMGHVLVLDETRDSAAQVADSIASALEPARSKG
jgi:5-(carboxyamino)imidazole ribonucleotide synthase